MMWYQIYESEIQTIRTSFARAENFELIPLQWTEENRISLGSFRGRCTNIFRFGAASIAVVNIDIMCSKAFADFNKAFNAMHLLQLHSNYWTASCRFEFLYSTVSKTDFGSLSIAPIFIFNFIIQNWFNTASSWIHLRRFFLTNSVFLDVNIWIVNDKPVSRRHKISSVFFSSSVLAISSKTEFLDRLLLILTFLSLRSYHNGVHQMFKKGINNFHIVIWNTIIYLDS